MESIRTFRLRRRVPVGKTTPWKALTPNLPQLHPLWFVHIPSNCNRHVEWCWVICGWEHLFADHSPIYARFSIQKSVQTRKKPIGAAYQLIKLCSQFNTKIRLKITFLTLILPLTQTPNNRCICGRTRSKKPLLWLSSRCIRKTRWDIPLRICHKNSGDAAHHPKI